MILAAAVFIASAILSFSNTGVLVDAKSALIVVGGTVTTTLICFSFREVSALVKVFFKRVIFGNVVDPALTIIEITNLARAAKKGKANFERAVADIRHAFLRDGAEILFWAEEDISDDELRDLLETRVYMQHERYMAEANQLKSVSQYPPAFGLMGTTIGMIALLQNLNDGGGEGLGQAMAIALITTLYGLVLSNFLLAPIAENLSKQSQEEFFVRRMIVEGLMLIHQGKPPRFVEEYIVSYVLPKDRPKK